MFTWLLLFYVSGCLQQKVVEPPTDERQLVNVIQTSDTSAMSVGMPPDLLATIHEAIGDGGKLTFEPTKPVTIVRPSASVTIPAGASVNYTASDEKALLTFSDPKPTITAKVFGVKLSPKLNSVELFADGTGMADVGKGLTHVRRKFALAWGDAENSQGATAEELPEVLLYSRRGCIGCTAVEHAMEALADKPFRVRVVTSNIPSWVKVVPVLHWQVENKWWKVEYENWQGGEKFVETWRKTRGDSAASSGQRRYVRHWTFPGNTEADLRRHLCEGMHCGRHDKRQLATMTMEQLLALHDADHEGE